MLAEDRVGWVDVKMEITACTGWRDLRTPDDQLGWSGADAGLKIDQIWNDVREVDFTRDGAVWVPQVSLALEAEASNWSEISSLILWKQLKYTSVGTPPPFLLISAHSPRHLRPTAPAPTDLFPKDLQASPWPTCSRDYGITLDCKINPWRTWSTRHNTLEWVLYSPRTDCVWSLADLFIKETEYFILVILDHTWSTRYNTLERVYGSLSGPRLHVVSSILLEWVCGPWPDCVWSFMDLSTKELEYLDDVLDHTCSAGHNTSDRVLSSPGKLG